MKQRWLEDHEAIAEAWRIKWAETRNGITFTAAVFDLAQMPCAVWSVASRRGRMDADRMMRDVVMDTDRNMDGGGPARIRTWDAG